MPPSGNPFSHLQTSIFDLPDDFDQFTKSVFQAYFDCRKNKRNTLNALEFEHQFETHLFQLADDLYHFRYSPGRSLAFIVDQPVKREVFAADFRDRIVHHWLIQKLNPIFESLFIPDSYACRVDKGPLYGIRRVEQFMHAESNGYQSDAFILKLDIQGFFMHINRSLLMKKLETVIRQRYLQSDLERVLDVTRKIVYNDPTRNCIIRGRRSDWDTLPQSKSLFHSSPDCGLPIGNLTSQVFANLFLHEFDVFVQEELNVHAYGRYVDDFVLIHPDRHYLKCVRTEIATYLKMQLGLSLHAHKVYFQHVQKGVSFLGVIIKPGRTYVGKRIKGNTYRVVSKYNRLITERRPDRDETEAFVQSLNAYFGYMIHHRTYRLRWTILNRLISAKWWPFVEQRDNRIRARLRHSINY